MSSNCQIKVKTKDEESLYADAVKSRLLLVFQKMANKITPDVFNEIFKQFEESGAVVKNVDQIVQTFKDNLYGNICENFNDMWHCQEIELQLNLLNFCKEKCKNNTTSWRPTGRTPEEQTKYLRIHYLKKKIAYIENALAAQSQIFNSTCKQVSEHRTMIEELNERRDAVSKQMDKRMEQINKSDVGASQRFQRDFGG